MPKRLLPLLAAVTLALALAGSASAARYIVVFKNGQSGDGARAVSLAGGKLSYINKIGIGAATSSRPDFALRLRSSGAVAGVSLNAAWKQPTLKPVAVPRLAQAATAAKTPAATAAAACSAFFAPPPGVAGPDPLNVCQWGNRAVNATLTGSYPINQGQGVRVGIMDTGVDLTHQDIAPNLDVGTSCSFIRPGNPTAVPQEIDPTNFPPSDPNGPFTGACATKSAIQDYNGHGTHVAGTVAAPINGVGVIGIAPKATIVALHTGTALGGYFFLQEVVDALVYAGDKRLDVVNMSFFIDPFLFNCHNNAEQQAIYKAVNRAAHYASTRGVVLVAAAGNEAIDLDHPTQDEISPDFPPGSEVTRPVGNQCVVLPTELSDVVAVSAIGVRKLLAGYSTYSNSKVDVTAPGGDASQTPGTTFGRILNAWSHTAPPVSRNPIRTVEDCTGPSNTPPCFDYVWISGTSMASPHVAGVAALIRAAHPGLPPLAVEAMLQNTAQAMYCPPDPRCSGNGGGLRPQTNFYGNGLVDALAASLKAR